MLSILSEIKKRNVSGKIDLFKIILQIILFELFKIQNNLIW